MSARNLMTIRSDFIRKLGDEDYDSFDALREAVSAVRKTEKKDVHQACQMVTHWAVEEGFIPEDAEDEAEGRAEEIVRSA